MNDSVSVFCVVGIKDSGRRAIVNDLLEALPGDDRPAALIVSATELEGFVKDFPGLPVSPWQLDHHEPRPLEFSCPEDTQTLFICSDGVDSPIHLMEALALWGREHNFPDLIITTVVHCTQCANHHPVLSWYQAAIHFSDFVMLNQREGVDNKWLADFQKPFQRQFFPCVFEPVRNGRLRNPAVILNSPPRRMSQAFEENAVGFPTAVDIEDDEEEEDEDGEDTPVPELHFERLLNKNYRRPIPNLENILK